VVLRFDGSRWAEVDLPPRISKGPTRLNAIEVLSTDDVWVGGNVQTLSTLFEDLPLSGAEAKVLGWEGGALVGMLARAVLAQFDPYRDQLLVVHPNLGDMAHGDGLRYLMFHEVTHLAQFREAPWIPEHIVGLVRSVLKRQPPGWAREVVRGIPERVPEMIRWARDAMEGRSQGMPLLDLLPDEQREVVYRLNALVTLLEGHATFLTEDISERRLPGFPDLKQRLEERRRRSPLVRLLEALAGLEMKRQQYALGRSFCEHVWRHGGAEALKPAWAGPSSVPTMDELRSPELWLRRVA
jgi:coenzyme F420 biosynthesis associated uncharacterized protein